MVEEAALITRPPVVKIIVDVVADWPAAGWVKASYEVRKPLMVPQLNNPLLQLSALVAPVQVLNPVPKRVPNVVEPVTVRLEEVAAIMLRNPPPSAFNIPPIVVEPVVVKLVPVAIVKSRFTKCDVDDAKSPETAHRAVVVAEVVVP